MKLLRNLPIDVESSYVIEGKSPAIKAYLIAQAVKATGKKVLVVTSFSESHELTLSLQAFLPKEDIIDLPAWETLPSENIPPSPDIVGERLQALHQFQASKSPVIVTNLQGACQHILPPQLVESLAIELEVGKRFTMDALLKALQKAGYQRRMTVTDKGEFAKRGSLIDLFAVSYSKPIRIEFFDDAIETMRFFDPMAQKSIEKVSYVRVLPSDELTLLKKESMRVTELLGDDCLLVLDDLHQLENKWVELKDLQGSRNRSLQNVDDIFSSLKGLNGIFFVKEALHQLSEFKVLELPKRNEKNDPYLVEFPFENQTIQAKRWTPPLYSLKEIAAQSFATEGGESDLFELFEQELLDWESTCFTYHEDKEHKRWAKEFEKRGLDISKARFEKSSVSDGFVFKGEDSFCLFPISDLKKAHHIPRKQMRSSVHSEPADVWSLKPGDLIVHIQNGIGKFIGMETRPNHAGIPTEFLLLEYAEKGKLFVPLSQAYLITKYIGGEENKPTLHTLGSSRWKRSREQTYRAIQKYAKELLTLQAQRELSLGSSCREDSEDMIDFEDEFPYQETDDQLEAIHNTKNDLMQGKATDRLICGDVGYGKTEVAMRAAFKAVVDGSYQVALLVPTTLLALQHYETFCKRMADYPVRIEHLSRFRKPKERKAVLEGVRTGEVDILIGTHRIVGKDLDFKNLGLVIVDEEHRFGVRIKEKLRSIKVGADFLALSATPIPRTLYLSMMGARDISLINTPPHDRLPIKTIVIEKEDEVIKQALQRELLRGGQAYFIHNRVESIYGVAKKLQELLPHARVSVVHGQMSAEEIDRVFHAFKSGETQILVATTIVENGVDIPNANTLIVDRADCYGVADLYQLRGRVGRWNRRAYAYFLVPQRRVITEDAKRRLDALIEAGGFGGGMKIAMRDLEIRGAGDILGVEQTGHVSQVGFHLYCKMLKRTVQALQGQGAKEFVDTRIEMPIDARIPENYIDEASLRMEMYQRIGDAVTLEEIEEIFAEIEDRYGKAPMEVEHLKFLSRIRVHAGLRGIQLLRLEKFALMIEFIAHKKVQHKRFMLQAANDLKEMEARILAVLEKFHPLKD